MLLYIPSFVDAATRKKIIELLDEVRTRVRTLVCSSWDGWGVVGLEV